MFSFTPIGTLRSALVEKAQAPRQPGVEGSSEARIDLVTGMDLEHAILDLETWSHLWLVFVFDRNQGWKPKVLPPRSQEKCGVLATRSPHRPNPIGLSAVKLERVEGLSIFVSGSDLLDGTPILDIKPYVPYADSIRDSSSGWLETGEAVDPIAAFEVCFSERAEAELDWLAIEKGIQLRDPLEASLRLGPEPHPYRRIRIHSDGTRSIAQKAWRADFSVDAKTITVLKIRSGYKASELEKGSGGEIELHRAFVARFAALLALTLALFGCSSPTYQDPSGNGSSSSASASAAPAPSPVPGARPSATASAVPYEDPKDAKEMEVLKFQFTSGVEKRQPKDTLTVAHAGDRVYGYFTLRNRTGRERKVHLSFSVAGKVRSELDLDVQESWSYRTWGYNTLRKVEKTGELELTATDDEGNPLGDWKLPIVAK